MEKEGTNSIKSSEGLRISHQQHHHNKTYIAQVLFNLFGYHLQIPNRHRHIYTKKLKLPLFSHTHICKQPLASTHTNTHDPTLLCPGLYTTGQVRPQFGCRPEFLLFILSAAEWEVRDGRSEKNHWADLWYWHGRKSLKLFLLFLGSHYIHFHTFFFTLYTYVKHSCILCSVLWTIQPFFNAAGHCPSLHHCLIYHGSEWIRQWGAVQHGSLIPVHLPQEWGVKGLG